jgi:hypothetical protein
LKILFDDDMAMNWILETAAGALVIERERKN